MDLFIRRTRQVLRQARDLRDLVQQDLATRRFGSDDLRMHTYNDLISEAAGLFQQDPVLNGQMIRMPDANLQSYGTLIPSLPPPELASQRLEERLTRLINRLEFLLGEPEAPKRPSRAAGDVLRQEQDPDVRQIIEALDQLIISGRQQSQLLDFSFVIDKDLRRVLNLDFVEAQHVFAVGAFKACGILAGGLIEGMLLDALQTPSVVRRADYAQAVARLPRTGPTINWDKVSMTQLIEAARDLQLLGQSALRFVDGARDFRDTVHPRAEVREQMRAAREEVEVLLALVKLIYRDLDHPSHR